MKRLAVLIVLISTPVLAQDAGNEARKARAFDTVTLQRNQAMDAVAVCVGEYNAQLEQLKRQLVEAQKACHPEEPKKD